MVAGLIGVPSETLIVGLDHGDDAAVVQLDGNGTAVLSTVDFFTPVVDDAYDWGRIGAANAFSDIYAMGGRPILAVNLLCWPRDLLPMSLAADVLRGGLAVAIEAGCPVAGGHSVDDPEPKYGMAVVGLAVLTLQAREGGRTSHVRTAVLAVACFMVLTFTGILTDVRIRRGGNPAAAVERLKGQLPPGQRLISFGHVDALFDAEADVLYQDFVTFAGFFGIPAAKTMLIDAWRITLMILFSWRKFGVRTEKRTQITKSTGSIPANSIVVRMNSFRFAAARADVSTVASVAIG